MANVLLAIHLFIALAIVGLVLLQRSEGGALGIGQASDSLFRARGSANLLTRACAVFGAIFFMTSLALAIFGQERPASILERLDEQSAPSAPAPPALPDLSTPPTPPTQ